jgi:hypothetical protein
MSWIKGRVGLEGLVRMLGCNQTLRIVRDLLTIQLNRSGQLLPRKATFARCRLPFLFDAQTWPACGPGGDDGQQISESATCRTPTLEGGAYAPLRKPTDSRLYWTGNEGGYMMLAVPSVQCRTTRARAGGSGAGGCWSGSGSGPGVPAR